MQKKSKSKKMLFAIITIILIVILGRLGGDWQQAFATTTIPVVDSIDPNEIPINSPTTQFKISGGDFIGQWGTEWTLIRWKGPDGQVLTIEPDSINVNGTEILVTFPSYLFTKQGIAEVVVINHPEDPDLIEVSSPLNVSIIDFIYLPLILK